MVLRSVDTMAATTIRYPEGTLIYVKDNRELYMRVHDGIREVMVIVYYCFSIFL